jgi:hypothetical protein
MLAWYLALANVYVVIKQFITRIISFPELNCMIDYNMILYFDGQENSPNCWNQIFLTKILTNLLIRLNNGFRLRDHQCIGKHPATTSNPKGRTFMPQTCIITAAESVDMIISIKHCTQAISSAFLHKACMSSKLNTIK